MTNPTLGWHTVPFPIDGADAATFVRQLDAYMGVIEDRYEAAWFDDHLVPWGPWLPRDTPALECMSTLTYLAARHPEIKVGSSVLCQSFRNPALVAKMAATLSVLTGGRFVLGMGAGWLEEEYNTYGYEFPSAPTRIRQLEEAAQVVRAAWRDGPGSFDGEHYRITDAECRPVHDPPPPLLIGGGGEKLTLRVVATHADWWNFVGSPASYGHKVRVLYQHCEDIGRDPAEIRLTWMAEVVAIADDEAEARRLAAGTPYPDDWPVVGTPAQVAEQLAPIVDLGVDHLILRFVDFPSTRGAELMADEVLPLLGGAACA